MNGVPAAAGKARPKPRVHRQLVRTLALEIMGAKFAPGDPLPPEPELCARFGVSRGTVREAVRVLTSKGLLAPRPRTGTLVRPRADWALLDAELLGWSMELAPDPEFVLGLIEARQVIEPAAAELAAHRAVPDDLAALQAAYHDMADARTRLDFAAFNQADIGFHHALLRASHNVVFEQLATTMSTALLYSFRMTIERAQEPGASLPNHGDVLDCIRARDGAGAFSAMSRLLDRALIDLGPPG